MDCRVVFQWTDGLVAREAGFFGAEYVTASGERKNWVMPPNKMSLLVSNHRRRIMPPTKTLRALGLRNGLTLLDAGCGPGFFTVPACRVVGKSGRVLACDTSLKMLRATRQRAKEIGVGNLQLKKSRDPVLPFPDDCADMVMLGFVLHETTSIRRFLAEARRVLRPGGRAVLMEWHPRQTDYGPPLWARLSAQETKRAARGVGLSVVGAWSFDDDTYFVMARHKNERADIGPFSAEIKKITRREP